MVTTDDENDTDYESEESHQDNMYNKGRAEQNVTLRQPSVLECCICFEPLKLPVFQCKEGHVACSACCSRNSNVCKQCLHFNHIGDVRCKIIENLLHSLYGPCENFEYGCKTKLRFSERNEHLMMCLYGPCPCPLIEDCNFASFPKQLSAHFSRSHRKSTINFQYHSSFFVVFFVHQDFQVLREEKDGVIFILGNRSQPLGQAFTLNRIGSAAAEEGLSFELVFKTKETTLRLRSAIKGIRKLVIDDPPPEEFLLIPSKFFESDYPIKLHVCIW